MKQSKIKVGIFIFALAITVSLSATAQVSADFSGGSVIIGTSTDTCNGTTEGALRYNTTSNVMEFCDGTTWREWG